MDQEVAKRIKAQGKVRKETEVGKSWNDKTKTTGTKNVIKRQNE